MLSDLASAAGRKQLIPAGRARRRAALVVASRLDLPAVLGDRLPVLHARLAAGLGLALAAELSVAVSATMGGTPRGLPSSSSATKTRYALEVWVRFPVTMVSDSTRTPTSSEVVYASLTEAFTVIVSPTWTGTRNESRPYPR